jgi:hypothetical protein
MVKNLLSNDIFEGCFFPLGALDEVVEVIDVGLVMFAPMVVKSLF